LDRLTVCSGAYLTMQNTSIESDPDEASFVDLERSEILLMKENVLIR
jgi:hypothetical protein